jgi:ATP-dependent phosphoenolpyruvate carboxykinase
MRPSEQGAGDYNKWYVDVKVVKTLVKDFDIEEEERVLVYVDEMRTTVGEPKAEYVGRMNRGIRESMELGLPEKWVEEVMRKFIPGSVV